MNEIEMNIARTHQLMLDRLRAMEVLGLSDYTRLDDHGGLVELIVLDDDEYGDPYGIMLDEMKKAGNKTGIIIKGK